jgi:hypothetical protein
MRRPAQANVTPKGYRRVRDPRQRRLRFEHVLVWEQHHGMPLPPGLEIHHVNEDKLDNRIENLRAVTRLEHKRLHSGCELRDGQWWKPCRDCGVMKPVDTEYYRRQGGPISSICRGCTITRAIESKRLRKLRARAAIEAAGDTTENTPADAEVSAGRGP